MYKIKNQIYIFIEMDKILGVTVTQEQNECILKNSIESN